MKITLHLEDATNEEERQKAIDFLNGLGGEPAEPSDETNDRPAKKSKAKKEEDAEEEDEPKDEEEEAEEAEEEEAGDDDESPMMVMRALAKKLIKAKGREAMGEILEKFEVEGISEIPPFKAGKAIKLIKKALKD